MFVFRIKNRQTMKYLRYGEDGVRIVFGDSVDAETNRKVIKHYYYLSELKIKGIIDITPSFNTCVIRFDNSLIGFEKLISFLKEKEGEAADIAVREPDMHELPVRYGGEYGPDMDFVKSYSGLSEEEVISIHSSVLYTVFAIGFMPGFPYLGTLDKRIYCPRLDTPRTRVPAGSIGLAQLQTGIYSFESPGGWQVIGRTDVRLFDHQKAPYSLLHIGDMVRFVPV